MPRLAPTVAALAILAAPLAARAADPFTDGRRAFSAGDYDRAEARLRKALAGPACGEARLVLADLLLLLDRAPEAESLAREALSSPAAPSQAGLLLARALVRRGAHPEAITVLREAICRDPEAHRARALLGETLAYLGRSSDARKALEPMVAADDFSAFRAPGDLVAVGVAARVLGRTRMAFQAFDEATVRDPALPEAQLELGLTALSKGDTVHAEQGFAAVLARQPSHPLALVGRARIELEIGRTYARAQELLDAALAVAPTLPGAHRLLAEIDLLAERPEAALERLDRVLAGNPRDLAALALKAAAWDALADRKRFEAAWQAARKVNPRYSALFTLAARLAERANRYADAVRLAERALKVDPDHWEAHAIIGVQLTRMGREDEGRRHLERYYERDDYDVRITNLLNLYERWLGDYVWVEDPDVRLRVHKDEAEVARRVILPFARDMLRRYDARYRWKAPRPVTLELFHKPNLFSLRSIGLPAVGSHGLCFGRLVTARSPSSNDFNWGMVVAHELSHVYALTMSKHRVPRWFTEGLSEYETNVLRPEWTREHGAALHQALQAGRLPGALDLTRAFTQANDLHEVVVAYQLAALVMHFLVETAGYDAVVASLKRFAAGERLPAVLRRLAKADPEAFDRRFVVWLRPRLAAYEKGWDFDEAAYRDGEERRKAADEQPDDPQLRAALAAHLLVSGSPEAALAQARRALELAPTDPVANYVAGKALMRQDRPKDARPHFEALLETGHDGYLVRQALAAIDQAAKRHDAARRHLAAARRWDLEQAQPELLLARIAAAEGDEDLASQHYERAAMLEQNDPDPPRWLVQRALRLRDLPNALRWTEHLRFIAPYEQKTHLLRAQALLLAGQDEAALAACEVGLSLEADEPEALGVAAQALLRLGRKAEAGEAARKALRKAPAQAAARQVLEALGEAVAP